MYRLPSYRPESIDVKEYDLGKILTAGSIDELTRTIYSRGISDFICNIDNVIDSHVESQEFSADVDLSASEEYFSAISGLIKRLHSKAIDLGFPDVNKQTGSKTDIALAVQLAEALEANSFLALPALMSSPYVQRFMTQRALPLLIHWRWKDEQRINKDRILHGNRNYFYTLWLTAWLFDKGKDAENRWDLLEQMSADTLVAIIERPGIGLRRGFAQAVSQKIKEKREELGDPYLNMDKMVRGVMKRATFTFSTAVMTENNSHYKQITDYLFDWSEKYYLKEYKSSKIYTDVAADMEKPKYPDFSPRYYIKKLTENELGYRHGVLANGQMFYISKQALSFFPPLSSAIINDSAILEFNVEYQPTPVQVNFVYHNDKLNREGGTRDEYRIYLNRLLAPDDYFFKPNDIIIMERVGKSNYNLKLYISGDLYYDKLNRIMETSKIRGQHALTDVLPLK